MATKNPPVEAVNSTFVTKKEAASFLRCTTRYVERMVRQGRIRAYRPTLADERFTIVPTSETLRALNDHHDAIVKRRRGELRDVTSYAARWNEQAWRIAVCLHAGTHGSQAHEQPVSLETAQRAIALADWFAAEQLRILNAGRTQRKIERLQRLKALIVQQYNGEVTLRTLQRNNGFEPAETRELAAKFPQTLVIERHETGGRPSEPAGVVCWEASAQ